MITTLTLKQITKTFSLSNVSYSVLKNISVTFQKNTSYAIIGQSGSGKSTLINILAGLDSPTHGQVLYNNQNLANLDKIKQKKLLQENIGIIFQNSYLIPELTVLENIIIKGLINKTPKNIAIKLGLELLEQINMQDKANSLPPVLSGGQAQRIAILRALLINRTFLLLMNRWLI